MSTPVEVALLKLGNAVASTVVKRWMARTVEQIKGPLTVDRILLREFPSLPRRRSVQRQFDQIADDVARRLEDYFRLEFNVLDDGEIAATAEAVATTMEAAELSVPVLLAVDLDPIGLEKALRAARPTAADDELLSAAGMALYDVMLRECANYVIEVAVSLPAYTTIAAREILRRETELIELVREVLDRLPQGTPGAARGATTEELHEQQYRREVARRFDRLELFGVTLGKATRRYSLSVAYISLAVARREETDTSSPTELGHASVDGSMTRSYLRVDEALAREKRHVIRGEAGSGKTTLLQWLAVRSARGAFDGPLKRWNGSVPFFIPLRRFVVGRLPEPEAFMLYSAPALAGGAPSRWVRAHLESGRGLVLVDGLDEVHATRRDEVLRWVEELCSLYPQSRFVVTTRPGAVDDGWLSDYGFVESDLQAMTSRDTRAFLSYWHSAVKVEADEAELAAIDALENALAAALADKPHLRALAANPLLCAMLCALNRDRRQRLPKYRTDLYRIAIEALLERRDAEREIQSVLANLDISEKESLIQDLAWWALVNGQTFITREVAERRVARRMRELQHVDIDAKELLDELLLRSGLIREPTTGQIDFVHRTFQEYFAAAETLDQDMDISLVQNASSDEWREVILLATGLARGTRRSRLIERLLDAADATADNSFQLRLLAVECLDTGAQISEVVGERVRAAIRTLVPPRDVEWARALAGAGDEVVPLLRFNPDWEPHARACCVRALAQIGSVRALEALSTYATDATPEVVGALLDAWARFDPLQYADAVLGAVRLTNGELAIHDHALIAPARKLSNLTRLSCAAPGGVLDAAAVSLDVPLVSLEVRQINGFSRLETLGTPLRLERLMVESAPELAVINLGVNTASLVSLTLERAPALTGILAGSNEVEVSLQEISIAGAPLLRDISGLRAATGLRNLKIRDAAFSSLDALERVAHLEVADFSWNSHLQNLDGLSASSHLRELSLIGCGRLKEVEIISGLCDLRELRLAGCANVESVEALRTLQKLEVLSLADCSRLGGAGGVDQMKALRRLNLTRLQLGDLTELGALPHLSELVLDSTALRHLDELSRFPTIQILSLRSCRRLANLAGLSALRDLRDLALTDVRLWDHDVSPMLTLSKLERITISEPSAQLAHVLSQLPGLQSVRVEDRDKTVVVDWTPVIDNGVEVIVSS